MLLFPFVGMASCNHEFKNTKDLNLAYYLLINVGKTGLNYAEEMVKNYTEIVDFLKVILLILN